MNPSTSLGTRSNVGMAKPSPPVRQAGNIGRLLVIHGVCRRSVPSACPQVKYRCRCRDRPGETLAESSETRAGTKPERSYWIPGFYTPALSEKHNSFLRLLKNKGFREER